MTASDTTPIHPPADADDDAQDAGATPEQGREALVSGEADPGGAPPGKEETVLEGLGRAIGNIVVGSLPDPGPRDGVARRDQSPTDDAK